MKILTAETALREETRSLEQAKSQIKSDKFETSANELSITQEDLANRTSVVIDKIYELPNGESDFGKEIKQLTNAANAMDDAEVLLAEFNTGAPAIAAETEAIEWLLMAKRAGSGSGGGGGSPGRGKSNRQKFRWFGAGIVGQLKREKGQLC